MLERSEENGWRKKKSGCEEFIVATTYFHDKFPRARFASPSAVIMFFAESATEIGEVDAAERALWLAGVPKVVTLAWHDDIIDCV